MWPYEGLQVAEVIWSACLERNVHWFRLQYYYNYLISAKQKVLAVPAVKHWPNSSDNCQLTDRERQLWTTNSSEMRKRERDRERGRGWKCAGNAEATLELVLLQNPDWTWKRFHCSCDGHRALTSVHQPRAASLSHLLSLLFFFGFASTMMRVSWATMRFCCSFSFSLIWRNENGAIERHVEGDGGIAGMMKKISLDNRYSCARGLCFHLPAL